MTCLYQGIGAGDVQEGLLLACKGCIRKVFCSGRGADRHIHIGIILLLHLGIGLLYLLFQILRKLCVQDYLPDLFAPFPEVVDVTGVKVSQGLLYGILYPGILQQVLIGLGSNSEAIWHLYPLGGKVLIHLPQ